MRNQSRMSLFMVFPLACFLFAYTGASFADRLFLVRPRNYADVSPEGVDFLNANAAENANSDLVTSGSNISKGGRCLNFFSAGDECSTVLTVKQWERLKANVPSLSNTGNLLGVKLEIKASVGGTRLDWVADSRSKTYLLSRFIELATSQDIKIVEL